MSSKERINFDDMRFVRVTRVVMLDEVFLDKPVHKLAYAVLCMYADNTTTKSHPSVNTIAKKCGCSENTVRSSLKRLEELELVGVERRKNGKENLSNVYTLYVPPKWFIDGDKSKFEVRTSKSK